MSDSDDDDDDQEREPNWDLLSETLGVEALQALRQHLQDKHTTGTTGLWEEKSFPSQPGPVAVKSNLDFKSHSYWEERFAIEDSYEWLANFEAVRPTLEQMLPDKATNPKLLLVGCGNSNFSADLFDAGWTDITSTDFSQVVIERMRCKEAPQRPLLKWEVADMLKLDGIEDASFDTVVDKAAMDALMCDEGSVWDPAEQTRRDAHSMCLAASRVLKPGGRFVQISFAQPHFRKRYLENSFPPESEGGASSPDKASACDYGWAVQHASIGEAGCLETYVYLCSKASGDTDLSMGALVVKDEEKFQLPPATAPPLLRQVT